MKKRYSPEQIVGKLRQADVELGKGLKDVVRLGRMRPSAATRCDHTVDGLYCRL